MYLPKSQKQDPLTNVYNELREVDRLLAIMPEGSASTVLCSGRRRIKGILNGKPHFYNQQELPLAKQLMYKKYLQIKREELLKQKKLLEIQNDYDNHWIGKANRFLLENPAQAELIADFFTDKTDPLYRWMAAPASTAAPYQEKRTEPSPAGYKVRSKSEVMIIVELIEEKRFFRYEDPLVLSGKIYYPDFTIRNPDNGKTYWYEHFGKMDDPEYAKKAFAKLTDYALHGLIPSVNLIVTFETSDQKLSFPQIRNALSLIDL